MLNVDHLWRALDAVAKAGSGSVERIVALEALRSLTESTLQAAVLRARENRVTWAAIGQGLGITRQAAFQRFGQQANKPEEPGDVMQQTLLAAAPQR